eukprot:4968972-Pleurochrysis_carterae.AAC.1
MPGRRWARARAGCVAGWSTRSSSSSALSQRRARSYRRADANGGDRDGRQLREGDGRQLRERDGRQL